MYFLRQLFLFAFLFLYSNCIYSHSPRLLKKRPEVYLTNKHSKHSHRYNTFLKTLDLLNQTNSKILVETGTSRCGDKNFVGDGGSTIIFAQWARYNNGFLYSVDISQENLDQAQIACRKFHRNVNFINSDSVNFLENFEGKIDFLYLDSYDFEFDNPLPSQLHHLKEIKAAYNKLHKNSIVLIDDCDLPHGGKGRFVISYLLDRDWEIVLNEYQVLMRPSGEK